MRTKFWSEIVNRRYNSEDLAVEGKIIYRRKIGWEGEEWIHLAQDGDRW
jgi:hypothetical protein